MPEIVKAKLRVKLCLDECNLIEALVDIVTERAALRTGEHGAVGIDEASMCSPSSRHRNFGSGITAGLPVVGTT